MKALMLANVRLHQDSFTIMMHNSLHSIFKTMFGFVTWYIMLYIKDGQTTKPIKISCELLCIIWILIAKQFAKLLGIRDLQFCVLYARQHEKRWKDYNYMDLTKT